jgi:hypothetical protein
MHTSKTVIAAGLAVMALSTATPAFASRGTMDPNGIWEAIVAWFTGDEPDKGVLIDPNG